MSRCVKLFGGDKNVSAVVTKIANVTSIARHRENVQTDKHNHLHHFGGFNIKETQKSFMELTSCAPSTCDMIQKFKSWSTFSNENEFAGDLQQNCDKAFDDVICSMCQRKRYAVKPVPSKVHSQWNSVCRKVAITQNSQLAKTHEDTFTKTTNYSPLKNYTGFKITTCRKILNNHDTYIRYSAMRCIHTTGLVRNLNGFDLSSIRKEPPWRIMFFGTDQIAVDTLKELHSNMIEKGDIVQSLDVVTLKEEIPRPVRQYADYANLNVQTWPIPRVYDAYDVGVLVSFGKLIPDSVIHMFPYGILNMHPSLLPRWRGASPIIHTILNCDKVTGISIMEIRPKHFDIGPLLLQRSFKVPRRCTSTQLAEITGRSGAGMVLECLKDLPKLEKFEHEQDPAGVTYAHKIKPKNSNIDWEDQTAIQVDCQYRALSFLYPLKTELYGRVVKLCDVVDPAVLQDVHSVRGYPGDIQLALPGTVGYHKQLKCLVIKCKENVIGFRKIVLRKSLGADDFYNGYINGHDNVRFTSLRNDINRFAEYERVPLKSTAL